MERIGKLAFTKLGLSYTWRNVLILYKNHVVVPLKSTIIDQLLREFHDSPLGGHSNLNELFDRIKSMWTEHDEEVKHSVNSVSAFAVFLQVSYKMKFDCLYFLSLSNFFKYQMNNLYYKEFLAGFRR
ncbi:hypothetical protein ACOSQ3_021203 [Xanthoceras sorbifolium]